MRNLIKNLPLPITGLMLGFATLGNLMQSYSGGLRSIFGVISALIFVLVALKIILFFKIVKEDLANPVVASVFPTFSMTMILFATYTKPFNGIIASFFWFGGILLHIVLMVWFTRNNVLNRNFSIKKVLPSWFIPYVGIAVASVTSGTLGMRPLGIIITWFAILAFIILFPIVLKRVLILKGIANPLLPCVAILAAPASLCLAGYLNSVETINKTFLYFLLTLAQVLYWAVILYTPRLLRLPFYPSYSGLTFPLVISGLALKLVNGFLIKTGSPLLFLPLLVTIEEIIAIVACIYVLTRYSYFLFAPSKMQAV